MSVKILETLYLILPLRNLQKNLEKVYAVAKAFENIGEAVKNIPKELTDRYPTIPWSEIAKMRDVLTHHYFGVDDKILWDTLGEDFDEFEKAIKDILIGLDDINSLR